MPKKIHSICFLALIVFFLYVISSVHDLFQRPLVNNGVVTSVKVYPGSRTAELIETLSQRDLISHPVFFRWLIDVSGARYALHYGEYTIEYPMTAWDLLSNIKAGTGLTQHRITIVNGWTFQQVMDALNNNPDLKHTLSNLTNQQILQKLGASQTHIEGLFYPNTYFFTWGNTDLSVLTTAYQKMQTLLKTDWQNRASNLPYTNVYQALIVASLIEKETALDSEKPLISSVIVNRLAKNMRLQIDPTVQYGLNKTFGGAITKTDLQTKTPYNTYLIYGLPPTPICIPSPSSIDAALHPATTDYLYYVATGDGGHHFSKTFEEHEKQVAAYRSVIQEDKK